MNGGRIIFRGISPDALKDNLITGQYSIGFTPDGDLKKSEEGANPVSISNTLINENENTIYLGASGGSASVSINGYYFLPTTDGAPGQVLETDGSGNVSWVNSTGGSSSSTSLERVDILSFGAAAGVDVGSKLGQYEWIYSGKFLLWEVVDSDKNTIFTDSDYSNDGDNTNLYNDLNDITISQNKNINVKAYYYKNQSKEKFRIVGRNYAYWSLVGLSNYGRMKDHRFIDPHTTGQNILNLLNSYFGIGNAGEGLSFTSTRNFHLRRHNSQINLQSSGKNYNYPGCYAMDYFGSSPNGSSFAYVDLTNYTINSRNDIYEYHLIKARWDGSCSFDDDFEIGTSCISISRVELSVTSNNPMSYPDFAYPLSTFVIRPVGFDTFILNNNTTIQNDDNIILISEPSKGTGIVHSATVYSQVDNLNFGEDLSNDTIKTTEGRYGTIRISDIGRYHGRIKNQSNRDLINNNNGSGNAGLFGRKNIKWRVAYGKGGVYTISDDYIYIRGNGRHVYGIVNGER